MAERQQPQPPRHRSRHPEPNTPGEGTWPDRDMGTPQVPELKFTLKLLQGGNGACFLQRLVQTPVRCLRELG